jgi:hypothetical protein
MRPLDLVALFDPSRLASGGEGENGECESGLTVADCIDWSKVGGGPGGGSGAGAAAGGAEGGENAIGQLPPGVNLADLAALADLVANAPRICWDQYRGLYGNHPAVRPNCR